MGFTIEDAITLLDSGLSDGLSEMTFAQCPVALETNRLRGER